MSEKTLNILLLLVFVGLSFQSYADTVKILEWNITGTELNGNPTNQNETTNIFNNENADIITLQDTGRGADEIATILDADYDLAVSVDGQEIWIIDNGRFEIDSTGTWDYLEVTSPDSCIVSPLAHAYSVGKNATLHYR